MKLSEKLNDLKDGIAKVQFEANNNGWTLDFERALILLEGYVENIKSYEDIEDVQPS
ncbi:hypothetical protein N9948_01580 [bacterium]|nr:hypothetical protein [bacterium]